jgi:PAS domain
VVDAAGYLAVANGRARSLFSLEADDIGRPFQDLEVSYRPLELRSKIQQVYLERRPSQVDEVEWPVASGEVVQLQAQILPLADDDQVLLGASIGFADVTRSRRYKEELEHANQGLEDAYAELQRRRPVDGRRRHQPARPAAALPGHLQPPGRRRQGRARGDRGRKTAAGHGAGRRVRVRGLEPLTRRLAADVADLGAP